MEHLLLDPIESDRDQKEKKMFSSIKSGSIFKEPLMKDDVRIRQQHLSHTNNNYTAPTIKLNFSHPKRKTRSLIRKILGVKLFQKNAHSSYLLSLFVILSFLQLFGYSKNVANAMSEETKYGLTTYAEPCTDECKQRGFPYTWCHKKPSRNGTWIDRDYCSQLPGTTRYLEPCLESCHQDRRERSGSFYWCRTAPTPRGDWDYCSPFPRW